MTPETLRELEMRNAGIAESAGLLTKIAAALEARPRAEGTTVYRRWLTVELIRALAEDVMGLRIEPRDFAGPGE